MVILMMIFRNWVLKKYIFIAGKSMCENITEPTQMHNICTPRDIQIPTITEITVPLEVEKTSEWCNSFVLVPKPSSSD